MNSFAHGFSREGCDARIDFMNDAAHSVQQRLVRLGCTRYKRKERPRALIEGDIECSPRREIQLTFLDLVHHANDLHGRCRRSASVVDSLADWILPWKISPRECRVDDRDK